MKTTEILDMSQRISGSILKNATVPSHSPIQAPSGGKKLCPYCEKEAPWISNEEVYGRRYGKSHMCYYCKECDAYVGCHNNTEQPLGTMANKELRQWRMKAHAHIDPLWKSGKMRRQEVYFKLKKHFGKWIHIGESDIETCKQILEINL